MAILDLISHVHLPSSVNVLPRCLKHFTFSSYIIFSSFNLFLTGLFSFVEFVFGSVDLPITGDNLKLQLLWPLLYYKLFAKMITYFTLATYTTFTKH